MPRRPRIIRPCEKKLTVKKEAVPVTDVFEIASTSQVSQEPPRNIAAASNVVAPINPGAIPSSGVPEYNEVAAVEAAVVVPNEAGAIPSDVSAVASANKVDATKKPPNKPKRKYTKRNRGPEKITKETTWEDIFLESRTNKELAIKLHHNFLRLACAFPALPPEILREYIGRSGGLFVKAFDKIIHDKIMANNRAVLEHQARIAADGNNRMNGGPSSSSGRGLYYLNPGCMALSPMEDAEVLAELIAHQQIPPHVAEGRNYVVNTTRPQEDTISWEVPMTPSEMLPNSNMPQHLMPQGLMMSYGHDFSRMMTSYPAVPQEVAENKEQLHATQLYSTTLSGQNYMPPLITPHGDMNSGMDFPPITPSPTRLVIDDEYVDIMTYTPSPPINSATSPHGDFPPLMIPQELMMSGGVFPNTKSCREIPDEYVDIMTYTPSPPINSATIPHGDFPPLMIPQEQMMSGGVFPNTQSCREIPHKMAENTMQQYQMHSSSPITDGYEPPQSHENVQPILSSAKAPQRMLPQMVVKPYRGKTVFGKRKEINWAHEVAKGTDKLQGMSLDGNGTSGTPLHGTVSAPMGFYPWHQPQPTTLPSVTNNGNMPPQMAPQTTGQEVEPRENQLGGQTFLG